MTNGWGSASRSTVAVAGVPHPDSPKERIKQIDHVFER